ncbi:hypothetical protein C2857_006092 [Epichloe festucae Fl1]|uniref:Transcription factor Iwr1 domain-containing protein n=1 Tax=Epichloe festucae (strain Fl1) TaxID=877507 RepID=A0A7S9PVT3_EPIFF|nr:hypothetical protein C2857_006092 [Epichloe festucae Fl1]
MSIPPQLIRVKRKRVQETPVTFLQFDQDSSKRHRSGRDWAYQRRETTTPRLALDSKYTQPVIHVSRPDDAQSPNGRQNGGQASQKPEKRPTSAAGLLEPRRFHVSRTMLAKSTNQNLGSGGVSKKNRYSPAVFVESARKKMIPKTRRSLAAGQSSAKVESRTSTPDATPEETMVEQRQLKRPGIAAGKARPAAAARTTTTPEQQPSIGTPLPESLMNRHNEDMEKIANDMNRWVLNELGANLQNMEQENRPLRFKPKSPAKRYNERHPGLAVQTPTRQIDDAMSDLSDDDDDDDDEWIIEEYVRIPAHSVALDVLPTDVGILVLDEKEKSMFFFGSELDDDEELGEDDEDENAENYYAADYPEDEADSGDEYGRQAYVFGQGNNSDDEDLDNIKEFENDLYEEQDEMVLEGDADEDDDARMARIREFMKRNSAFQYR